MHSLKFSRKDIFIFFMFILILIPLFKIPYIIVSFSSAAFIYKILLLFSFSFITLFILKDKLISLFELLMILFCFILLFSTILNRGELTTAIMNAIQLLILCFVVNYGFNKNTSIFLNSFEFFLYLLVVINFLTVLLFPNGLYESHSISFFTTNNWFLGFKNNHIVYIIPAILISSINSIYSYHHISFRTKFLFLVSFITVLLVKSGTSIFGLSIILIFYFLIRGNKNYSWFNSKSITFIFAVLFLVIVVFRLQNIFSFLIVDIMHKDITFTNRVYVWDYVIKFILKKPLFGYGFELDTVRYFKTLYYRSYHAHNQVYELIYKSGFLGFFVFCIIYRCSFVKLYKFRFNKITISILVVLLSILIMSLTEAFSLVYIFLPLIISYNVNKLCIKES